MSNMPSADDVSADARAGMMVRVKWMTAAALPAVTFYILTRLPHDLHISDSYGQAFYISQAITFTVLSAATLYSSIRWGTLSMALVAVAVWFYAVGQQLLAARITIWLGHDPRPFHPNWMLIAGAIMITAMLGLFWSTNSGVRMSYRGKEHTDQLENIFE